MGTRREWSQPGSSGTNNEYINPSFFDNREAIPISNESSPEEAHIPTGKCRRERRQFTTMQLEYLENVFKIKSYVHADERKKIAKELNLTEVSVKVWFQNRRTKHKLKLEQQKPIEMAGSFNIPSSSRDMYTDHTPSNRIMAQQPGNFKTMTREMMYFQTPQNSMPVLVDFGTSDHNYIPSMQNPLNSNMLHRAPFNAVPSHIHTFERSSNPFILPQAAVYKPMTPEESNICTVQPPVHPVMVHQAPNLNTSEQNIKSILNTMPVHEAPKVPNYKTNTRDTNIVSQNPMIAHQFGEYGPVTNTSPIQKKPQQSVVQKAPIWPKQKKLQQSVEQKAKQSDDKHKHILRKPLRPTLNEKVQKITDSTSQAQPIKDVSANHQKLCETDDEQVSSTIPLLSTANNTKTITSKSVSVEGDQIDINIQIPESNNFIYSPYFGDGSKVSRNTSTSSTDSEDKSSAEFSIALYKKYNKTIKNYKNEELNVNVKSENKIEISTTATDIPSCSRYQDEPEDLSIKKPKSDEGDDANS